MHQSVVLLLVPFGLPCPLLFFSPIVKLNSGIKGLSNSNAYWECNIQDFWIYRLELYEEETPISQMQSTASETETYSTLKMCPESL